MHLLRTRGTRRGLALAAAILLSGASPPPPPPPSLATQPEAGGALAGVVRDQAHNPIAHAQVFVVGTTLAATSDDSGRYRIADIPVGQVTIQAAFIGYKRLQVTDVQILPDTTVTLDLMLEATPFQVESITVVPGNNGRRVDSDYTRRLPVDRVSGVLRLQPGAVVAGAWPKATKPATTNGLEEASTSTGDAAAVFGNARAWRHHRLGGEEYRPIEENRFLGAVANPLSTFSIDVDRASYANVRRFIRDGMLPPADAVRIEELINYFDYHYPGPEGDAPLAVYTEVTPSPWHPDNLLVRIALQGKRIEVGELPPSNLVFLLDVSGSMASPDKLPLVQAAFRLLVDQLRPQDRVAIVVYAGAAGLVLPSTPGNQKEVIRGAINRLDAGGSTAGGAGIQLAYDVARAAFLPRGNNRVILATDGDFNVGITEDQALVHLIETRRREGTFLTVLGFGTGNYKDGRMEQLADKGNGNFAYIDNILEAKKVFLHEFGATLHTIAKDVKLQIEFNPGTVTAYRLIGYENRLLAAEDFNDDTRDAGELGAGHTVTALYEIIPVGAASDLAGAPVDPLRYQPAAPPSAPVHPDELLTVKLRYKRPEASTSRKLEVVVAPKPAAPSADLRFAAAVASFGMLLRDSEYRGSVTFDDVLAWTKEAKGDDAEGYRAEFIGLVDAVRLQHLTER